jgi:hypothetical protein
MRALQSIACAFVEPTGPAAPRGAAGPRRARVAYSRKEVTVEIFKQKAGQVKGSRIARDVFGGYTSECLHGRC